MKNADGSEYSAVLQLTYSISVNRTVEHIVF